MKHFKLTIPLVVILTATISIYLLQSCGGVHYDSYVERYKGIAMEEMQRTGYPASIKLAQAILESEGGRGKVAFEYNNHFGILCKKNWPGKRYYQEERDFNTGESREICYRVYNNPKSSFVAHTDLMRANFRTLFHKIDPMDYVTWANRLADLDYSGNENYHETLINMIERYSLYEFDEMAMGFDDRPHPTASDSPNPNYETARPDYKDRRTDQIEKYRERLDDLEEGINNHRQRYSKPTTNRRYENPRAYETATYEEPTQRREYREAPPSSFKEDRDYYTHRRERPQNSYYTSDEPNRDYTSQHSYPSRTSSNSRFNPDQTDDKYEGFSTESTNNYQRPTRDQEYNRPSYNNRQKDSPEEDWQEVETTSISDFRMAEDYAYINGVKVTTARYDDTPLMIAKRFNISVKDIIRFNEQVKSTKQLLREDQRIYLEAKKNNYTGEQRFHAVQFGERMKDIADMYGLSLNGLYKKNKMPLDSEPALGEKIKLDRGKVRKQPELRYKAPKPLTNQSYLYPENSVPPSTPVVGGSPTQSATQQQSQITTFLLQPVSIPNAMFHTVQQGETLYSIAQRYTTTTNRIMQMNGLPDNIIKSGMRLKVK